MDLNTLTDIANDLAVARLEVKQHQEALEAHLAQDPKVKELQELIDAAGTAKRDAQDRMMEAMQTAQLKSYKTDYATISRSKRETVKIKKALESEIKQRLKAGEDMPYFELNETEYISIRAAK